MSKSPCPNVRMNQFSPSLEVISYRDANQYWGNSVLKSSYIVSPFHVLNSLEASFQVERKLICFHIKAFSKGVSKYLIHLRETYALGKSANQWKHHLMNKETVIQTNQQPLQYFQNQTKLQQFSHYSLMGLLQQVHLVIRNQESISSQVVGLMSKKYLIVSFIPQYRLLICVNSIEQYPVETIFKDVYESLIHGTSWKEVIAMFITGCLTIFASCIYRIWKKQVTNSK